MIFEFKSAEQFFGRLTEVEKCLIRRATPDGLEHMRTNAFLVDCISQTEMSKAKTLVDAQFRKNSQVANFGSTWTH